VVTVVLVLASGGIGAVARFAIDALVESRTLRPFPLGTLVVNVLGCFGLGLIAGAGLSHESDLILGTAGIGSYTTFSTWMLETHRPAEDGDARLAWLNFVASVLAGLVAVFVGRLIAKAL
jgi:CrcB protein